MNVVSIQEKINEIVYDEISLKEIKQIIVDFMNFMGKIRKLKKDFGETIIDEDNNQYNICSYRSKGLISISFWTEVKNNLFVHEEYSQDPKNNLWVIYIKPLEEAFFILVWDNIGNRKYTLYSMIKQKTIVSVAFSVRKEGKQIIFYENSAEMLNVVLYKDILRKMIQMIREYLNKKIGVSSVSSNS
jgi:inorganic pyrophosphatase/exopolyphosphatase